MAITKSREGLYARLQEAIGRSHYAEKRVEGVAMNKDIEEKCEKSYATFQQILANINNELQNYNKIIEMNRGRIRLATKSGNKDIAEKLGARVADYEARTAKLSELKAYAEKAFDKYSNQPSNASNKTKHVLEEILAEVLAEVGSSKYAKI